MAYKAFYSFSTYVKLHESLPPKHVLLVLLSMYCETVVFGSLARRKLVRAQFTPRGGFVNVQETIIKELRLQACHNFLRQVLDGDLWIRLIYAYGRSGQRDLGFFRLMDRSS